MADKKNKEQATEQVTEQVTEQDTVQAHYPDASGYVLQPTSYKLDPAMGKVPADRFQEEVRKGSEEDSGDGVEAHPYENQPAYGVTEEGQPDTTGRAPLRAQKSR